MKRTFAVLLALALTFALFTVVPSAAGTNPAYTLDFTEKAPTLDGVISTGEYGDPIVSWAVSDGEKDGILLAHHEIKDDPDLSIGFYATWTETDLYLAWEVHTKYNSCIPQDIEDGYMYEYCCVQFLLTPGAPDNTVTRFQTEQWSGNYLEVGITLRDDGLPYKVCWSQPVGSALETSEWDFAGSRDGDKEISVYECRLPLEKLGIGTIGDGTQFGLTWAVGAQENYEKVAKGLIEWQDAIIGGKNADNAAVMTLAGSGKEVPSNPDENNFLYRIENGGAIVTGYTGRGGDTVIPDRLGGYPVTAIDDFAFDSCTTLTGVVIPKSVKSIGIAAFQNCSGLKSIVIPEGVTNIPSSAFAYAGSLQSVTLPDSLLTIERGAFAGCTSLTGVAIPKNVSKIEDDVFYGCGSLKSITVAEGNPVYYAENNQLIEKTTNTLMMVLTDATTATIPEGITVIGKGAFSHCYLLASITIPDSVISIKDDAFYSTSLKSIHIPASVKYVGSRAFDACAVLSTITVAEGNPVYYAKDNCLIEKGSGTLLRGPSTREVKIPEEVKAIGERAFYYCTALQSVTIPDGVKSIGDRAFAGCELLKSITIPSSVKTMEADVFRQCPALTDITCKAAKKPNGWNNAWLGDCKATVRWEAPALSLGDVDGDGKIDAADYLQLKRAVLGTFTLSADQKLAADVTEDGVIDALDYLQLKRMVLGTFTLE